MLSEYTLCGWSSIRAEIQKELQVYWSFRDEILIIDGMPMKGERIIIMESLQGKVLNHQHMNHMGIEKTRLLACKSIYWINMNADIKDAVKNCPTCFDFQATQLKHKTISHKIPGRPWESIRADIFNTNNRHYFCIVDYHSKFPVIKQMKGFSTDNVIQICRCLYIYVSISFNTCMNN